MKLFFVTLLLGCLGWPLFAQEVDSLQFQIDSIEASLRYQHGVIKLKNGIGSLKVPSGFKYLDDRQSNYVISELWGHSDAGPSLGMLIPDSMGVLGADTWAFNVQYDEIGYVKDDDAGRIDYNQLLEEMRNDTQAASQARVEDGYPAIELIGWAARPSYDVTRKILHWAKELKVGEDPEHTLNYHVRLLGRRGVLVLNAVASMHQFPQVNGHINKLLNIINFADGNRYADFNPDADEIAAYTVGSLVAGKMPAEARFPALLLKFWKVLAVVLIIAGGLLWRMVTGGRKQTGKSKGQTVV
jgi:uncharacterized membrane-anchored protein